jgi:hypothetical protein
MEIDTNNLVSSTNVLNPILHIILNKVPLANYWVWYGLPRCRTLVGVCKPSIANLGSAEF